MKSVRVLVIDDSAFMRKVITDILQSDPRIEVIGTARNGRIGLRKIKELSPDVVTLDIEMPEMDGLTALKHIMDEHPLPVVMLSNMTTDGAKQTIQAISLGAIDFVTKSSGAISPTLHEQASELIEKVVAASKVSLCQIDYEATKRLKRVHSSHLGRSVVAIGTSTGGPRALQKVLEQIPGSIAAPIFIVQHMPPRFTKSLADRLDKIVPMTVKEADDGEIAKDGVAYIAPGGIHMNIDQSDKNLIIRLSDEPQELTHRPSVNQLFASIASLSNIKKIAVILTGMGKDGAKGIQKMVEIDPNTYVITESQASAVVFGMPKAAIQTGYVHETLHIDHVGNAIKQIVKKHK